MMRNSQKPGLDELMIVNPSPSDERAFFLGEDGILYRVQGLSQEQEPPGLGQFFLGDDGTLYQVKRAGLDRSGEPDVFSTEGLSEEKGRENGRFFLGEDGTLYEVVGK